MYIHTKEYTKCKIWKRDNKNEHSRRPTPDSITANVNKHLRVYFYVSTHSRPQVTRLPNFVVIISVLLNRSSRHRSTALNNVLVRFARF